MLVCWTWIELLSHLHSSLKKKKKRCGSTSHAQWAPSCTSRVFVAVSVQGLGQRTHDWGSLARPAPCFPLRAPQCWAPPPRPRRLTMGGVTQRDRELLLSLKAAVVALIVCFCWTFGTSARSKRQRCRHKMLELSEAASRFLKVFCPRSDGKTMLPRMAIAEARRRSASSCASRSVIAMSRMGLLGRGLSSRVS